MIKETGKTLLASALVVWACSSTQGAHQTPGASGAGPVMMTNAGGEPSGGAGSMEPPGGGNANAGAPSGVSGMIMVPDAMAQEPPKLVSGYKTVTAACDTEFDITPTAATGMKVFYVYAKGSFSGVSANDLSAVRVLGTFSVDYMAKTLPFATGYQQYTIPSLIKDGEVLVMCGVRYEATTTPSYIYYTSVTILLPTLTLG